MSQRPDIAGISLIRVRQFNDEIRKRNHRIFMFAHLGGAGNNPPQISSCECCIDSSHRD